MYDKLTASVDVADLVAQAKVISNTLSDNSDYQHFVNETDFLVFCEDSASMRNIQRDGKDTIPFYDYKGVLLKSRNYYTAMIDRLSWRLGVFLLDNTFLIHKNIWTIR